MHIERRPRPLKIGITKTQLATMLSETSFLSLVADAPASLNGRFPTLRYRVAFISSIGGCHYFDSLPYRRSGFNFMLFHSRVARCPR